MRRWIHKKTIAKRELIKKHTTAEQRKTKINRLIIKLVMIELSKIKWTGEKWQKNWRSMKANNLSSWITRKETKKRDIINLILYTKSNEIYYYHHHFHWIEISNIFDPISNLIFFKWLTNFTSIDTL